MAAPALIKRNARFLYRLARTKSARVRHGMLARATRGQIQAIQEICYNILKFRVNLKHQHKRRLATHASLIRQLAAPRSEQRIREILRSGNGSLFAPLILPLLNELMGRMSTSE